LSQTAERLADDVVQLTGFSHLCPNRILCMTLDIYEQRLSESNPAPLARPLLALMRRFPSKRLTEAVNFQLLAHNPASMKQGSRPLPAPSKPSQFLAVAALIAQGLVNLDDVWSYLDPGDDVLRKSAADLMTKYEEEVTNLSKVDLATGSGKKDKDTFKSLFQQYNQATHQKFRLAAALISVNCWWAANRVLLHLRAVCKPCLNHYVREALCDLLKWMIAPLLVSTQKRLPHQTKATLETTYGAERRFGLGLEASEKEGAGDGGDAPAALRQVKDLDQFIPQAKVVLEHLEYFLHTDVHLLSSLWKVMGAFVRHREKAEKAEKPEKKGKVVLENGALSVIYTHLLPAASLVPNNCYLGDLMWSVMSQLNEFQRNLIYSCWDTMYDGFLLKFAYEKTKVATKQILKRVVANADRKDLIAHQAHFHISKLCSSNPIPVLEVMLKDVEIGFNVNMLQPYVECTTRCSELTADVMSFIFSRSCNRPLTEARKFLNQSDAMLSPWLSNLGEFVGRFYKKHPHTDMNGLLQVVTKRINSEVVADSGTSPGMVTEYKGESLIRVILESLIEHMGGYLTVADMNAEQLACLAGGPRLKSESVSVGKKEDASRKDRARQALFTALVDLNLVPVLWHSLGQQRHHFLSEGFSEANSGAGGTKLLGLLFDGNHECFLKVTEFLTQACSREKYMALLPPLRTIFSIFEPALAFMAVRHGLPPYGIPVSKASKEAAAAADAVVPAADGAAVPAAEAVVETAPELKEIEKVIRFYLPSNFESEGLSLLFYTTFWRLSLQDISMPASSYEKAIKGLDEQIKLVEKQKKELEYKRDRDHSREYKNLKKEVNRLQEVITKLKEEQLQQSYCSQRVRARLDKEKSLWFTTPSPAATAAFVAEMICPRVLTSHADALFCCHFVRFLIDLKTPGFQLLDFYNSWTIMLTQCIRCCSEREAQIFGVFLREMMSYVIELRMDEAAYAKASKDNPAFYRNYHNPKEDDPGQITMTAYADLLKGHAKWEGRIFKAMKQGLDSDDWMEKRNMLLMLSQSTTSFPTVYKYGQQILAHVEALRDKEDNEHQDIKTLARSLAVKLQVRSQHWVDRPPPGEKDAAREKDAKRAKNSLTDRDRDRDGKREDIVAEKRPRREDDPGEKQPRESRDGRDGKSDKAKPAKEKDGREPKDARPGEKARSSTRVRDAEKPREKDRDAPRESSKSARDKDSDRKRSSQLQPVPPPPHSGDRRPPSAVADDRHEKRRRTERDAGGDHRGSGDRHSGRDGGGHRNALSSAPASRAPYYDDRPRYDSRSGGGYGSSRHSDYPPRR